MFEFFYRPRQNRSLGGSNAVFTCACSNSGGATVQVFASNIREASRKCQRRAEELNQTLGTNMTCGAWNTQSGNNNFTR
jgi:hypothetical protein